MANQTLRLDKTHPFSERYLDRYELNARRQLRANLTGGHLTRRRGQSLEFRDFMPYTPGDDVRHIDWRSSARYQTDRNLFDQTRNALLVRRFEAEEQFRLVISLDTRASLMLPDAMPKYQIAAWLAEAIAGIALRQGDQVVLHDLFGKANSAVTLVPGHLRRTAIRSVLQKFASAEDHDQLNLQGLQQYLPPTAVWLIVTDAYFSEDTLHSLATQIRAKRDGSRWVIVVELDSWPHEQTLLDPNATLVSGPDLPDELPRDTTGASVQKVADAISAHCKQFRVETRLSKQDYVCWQWEQNTARRDWATFFEKQFRMTPVIRRLFMRDAMP